MAVKQLSFFDCYEPDVVVNVASVPQRSPFRYPGGKTWLVPRVRRWLNSLPKRPAEFIEPFLGGGIVSLTVAFESLADHITMAELDEEVGAVWQTIVYGDVAWLANRIAEFDCNSNNVNKVLSSVAQSVEETAFKTILKNRVFHGGILAPGSSLIKYGENGKGITSRWYPETLRKRIQNISVIKEKLSFAQGDGLELLRENRHREDAVFFIDPPYTAAGKKAGTRLYTHYQLDHDELFRIVATLKGDFVMTYDNAQEVVRIALNHGFDTELIAMKNTHHARMKELLIGRDLGWLRRSNSLSVAGHR